MSLEAQCGRCQGYFRNFQQVVRRGEDTYCVQCDAAIADGAEPKMYDRLLPASCIMEEHTPSVESAT